MRITLNLSDDLMKELESISSGKTKTQMFTEVLEDYIRKQKKEKLLALQGKMDLDYDWRAEEEKELLAVGVLVDTCIWIDFFQGYPRSLKET